MIQPNIYFYIPHALFPKTIPQNINENWAGFGLGIYAWILQTYLRLKADGFPCQLVDYFPQSGIVLTHRNCLSVHKPSKPGRNLLLICIKAESNFYPYAQLHVVQNPEEVERINPGHYIPHWPQPGLIPRDYKRGERFENVVFFGHLNNLAPELLSDEWKNTLSQLGLNWCPIINKNHWTDYQTIDPRWNDYSQADAVVAIRSFGKENKYINKPATKLFNAWLAGVPAVLGYESAYRAEGIPNFHYLEVTSLNELLFALKQLKSNQTIRKYLIRNAQSKLNQIHRDKITQNWRYFLEETATAAFYEWCSKPRQVQNMILESRYLSWMINRGQSKIASFALNTLKR
ncbi:hypothetical protein M595_2640 [Lyngbya aestuarii BL J]|uniref:Glycosyl transferases group 1 family protein n=1 Tax=Lyngbya aestuarii BL J TaxID=1348334 RepID=U7QHM1_9CYAN|nr:hypothetical protein [Lyngbya aestuarii]ERT07383.1 hypothetical protein M595_2640 [Lyngbya aestuarii BL J]